MSAPVVDAIASAAAASPGRPWRRGLVWLLFLGPFFFLSYGFANWLASQRTDVGAIVFEWERGIPFLAWSIVPYWSIDVLYVLSLLLARSRIELDGHAKRLLCAQLVSVACFLAFPLRFTFDRPDTDGVFGWLFDVLLGFDKPFNQAPSLHISLLVILWMFYARHLHGAWRWLLRLWAVLIGLSVLTTYQHHFIDIPTGILVGSLSVLLFPLDPSPKCVQRDPRRWFLGGCYLVGAGLFAVSGFWLGGGGWWLLWPACALATVAGIYFSGQPSYFRARHGRMEEAVAVLLAPFLVAAWINSRWWTRHAATPNEVVPGLWLSRLPSSAEIEHVAPRGLINCAAELSVDPRGRALYAVPMLDLLVPEIEQIDQGVAAIRAARQSGPALVFCALGYSRSASVVVAWLLDQRHAMTIDAAIAIVRRARPRIVLSAAERSQLERWYARRLVR